MLALKTSKERRTVASYLVVLKFVKLKG